MSEQKKPTAGEIQVQLEAVKVEIEKLEKMGFIVMRYNGKYYFAPSPETVKAHQRFKALRG